MIKHIHREYFALVLSTDKDFRDLIAMRALDDEEYKIYKKGKWIVIKDKIDGIFEELYEYFEASTIEEFEPKEVARKMFQERDACDDLCLLDLMEDER